MKIQPFKFNHDNEVELIADIILKINQIIAHINKEKGEK